MEELPLLINEDNKYPAGLAIFVSASVLYLASNHFHVFAPIELQRTWVDLAVPFMPNTVWIYLSEYLFFPVVYVACRDTANLSKYMYSFLSLQLVSCLVFVAWPTTYPRDLFPLPDGLNALTAYVFSALRQTDTPANCCPSLHVSSVYLATLPLLDEGPEARRKYFPVFFAWATAIAVSTLTTKQHYLIDVVAGFALGLAHFFFYHRYLKYRRLATA